MKEYVPTYPNPDDDDRPEWEKKLRPSFSVAEDLDGEGARPSSLIPACKMPDPGLGYELMLMRELKITNERTVRELGPLPPGGLPVQQKRRSTRPYTDFLGRVGPDEPPITEEDEMNLSQIAGSVALSAAVMVGECAVSKTLGEVQPVNEIKASATSNVNLTKNEAMAEAPNGNASTEFTANQKGPRYRKSFNQCMDASNGVTVDMMNCINGEFDYQDKRLNAVYKRLHQVLIAVDWKSLRNAQRKWLTERDLGCEVDDDMKGGTVEMLILANCALRKTASRADELETLLKQQNH